MVLFQAAWAEQCAQVWDVLTDLSKKAEYASALQFISVQAEDLSEVSMQLKIEAVPTVVFIRGGKEIDRINGVNIAALSLKCQSFIGGGAEPAQVPLEQRLKTLINQAKVMIFMKGNRTAPRCGFSRTLIDIINQMKVDYETFDILSDEEVRQGLKEYSDWPTYPQVYVNGELIGGLDIIKELVTSGSLASTLDGSA